MRQLHLWPWRVQRVPCPVCGKRTPADKLIRTWTTQALRMREAGAQNILPFWTGCHRCWLNWHNAMSSDARNTYNSIALQIGQHVGAQATLVRLQDIEPAHYAYPNGSKLFVGGIDNPGKIMSTEYDLISWSLGLDKENDG